MPYRLKSQTSTIAAKHYAPPLVDDGNEPRLSALRLGPSAPLLLSTYCQMDLPLLTGMHFLWFENRKRVLNRYCRTLSYSECFAGKTFDLYS
jgi:hypothetical protein